MKLEALKFDTWTPLGAKYQAFMEVYLCICVVPYM